MQVNNAMLQDYNIMYKNTHSILILKKLAYSLAGTAVLWKHLVIQRDGRKTLKHYIKYMASYKLVYYVHFVCSLSRRCHDVSPFHSGEEWSGNNSSSLHH